MINCRRQVFENFEMMCDPSDTLVNKISHEGSTISPRNTGALTTHRDLALRRQFATTPTPPTNYIMPNYLLCPTLISGYALGASGHIRCARAYPTMGSVGESRVRESS
jgi:hypothetical protein